MGKAYLAERLGWLAEEELATAKALDPNDPTPWLYEAIGKELTNRPVEALRDFEEAIRRNDNRAVYRSRLLLDQDRAGQVTNIARIYNNLGFQQLGRREAVNSLTQDPMNWSAHRFLADIYPTLQLHETARASELLQSQLLQPLGAPAVPPSAMRRDLTTVAASLVQSRNVDEITRLFDQDGFRGSLAGTVGNASTYGAESVLGAQHRKVAFNAGALYSTSDGFRDNQDFTTRAARLFAQTQPTPLWSLQTEYRALVDRRGDRGLQFTPDMPLSGTTIERDEDLRIGVTLRPSADVVGIGSLIQNHRIGEQENSSSDRLARSTKSGPQAEGQFLWANHFGHTILGGGSYRIDVGLDDPFAEDNTTHDRYEKAGAYLYQLLTVTDSLDVTVGLSAGRTRDTSIHINKNDLYPKLGFVWQPLWWLSVRAAAFRVRNPPLVAEDTLEPTHVAGFDQFLDNPNNAESTDFAAGADFSFGAGIHSGLSARRRNINGRTEFVTGQGTPDERIFIVDDDDDERIYEGYISWAASDRLAVSFDPQLDLYRSTIPDVSDLDTSYAPLTVRYFHPSGWKLQGTFSFIRQDIEQQGSKDENNSMLFDLGIGYQLPWDRGEFSLDILNILDQEVTYQDDQFRFFNAVPPPFSPERLVLLSFTLRF